MFEGKEWSATLWEVIEVTSNAREEMIDVTDKVNRWIREKGIEEGVCVLYVPHTTAAVTVNENADPDVCRDILSTLAKLVPRSGPYFHREGNADAHVKASLVGHSAAIPVIQGRLGLGTWQGVFFCEFDGPRRRKLLVGISR